jgi:hypothetical protein
MAVIPWTQILNAIPLAVAAAKSLRQFWADRPRPQPLDPAADPRVQIAQLEARVAALEATEAEQTKLMEQMAVQLQAIARRLTIAYACGVAGVALGAVAMVRLFI